MATGKLCLALFLVSICTTDAGMGHLHVGQNRRALQRPFQKSDGVMETIPLLHCRAKHTGLVLGFMNTAVMCAEIGDHFLESAKDFMMGAVSGGIASFSVFPIDMAKTRLQDQRVVAGAELAYKNTVQTIGRVFKEEGFSALYSGVIPVITGSAPEAALQLGGNNFGRAFLAEKLDVSSVDLPVWAELLGGGLGGVMQVFATQPMERVKILQQVC